MTWLTTKPIGTQFVHNH